MLGKRYSDFKTLYSEAKNIIPNDYKFPNKSIFSNSAQFTKERRIRGFDELIKHLMKSTEGFILLEKFIEIRQQLKQHRTMQGHHSPTAAATSSSRLSSEQPTNTDDSEIFEQSSSSNQHNRPSLSPASHKSNTDASPEELATRRELLKQAVFLQQKHVDAISHLSHEDNAVEGGNIEGGGINFAVSRDDLLRGRGLQTHLLFALKASMIFYLLISLLGIVEVASLSQALLTLVALTVLAMLIKLQIDRQELAEEEEQQTADKDIKG